MLGRILIIVVFLALTGWLHGRWTDRWGVSGDTVAAAAALPTVPLVLGDWEGRDITREESEIANRSSSPQLLRRYVNRNSGETIGLLVTCGRPGSMIIEHNPKICYSELGFDEIGDGRRVPFTQAEKSSEFYAHTFVKTTPTRTSRLRVLWSWGDARNWSFPDRPRIEFAKLPVLYKIYVTREMLMEDEPIADDAALAFLRAALPELTAALSAR